MGLLDLDRSPCGTHRHNTRAAEDGYTLQADPSPNPRNYYHDCLGHRCWHNNATTTAVPATATTTAATTTSNTTATAITATSTTAITAAAAAAADTDGAPIASAAAAMLLRLLLLFHSNRSRLLSLALRLVAVHCTGASRALNHMDKVEFRYE